MVWLTQCPVQLTQSVRPPPYMEKNKLILNEYLGIFMHFESIFFFNLENGIFQTHPPTKSGKFQIFFLKPSLWEALINGFYDNKEAAD